MTIPNDTGHPWRLNRFMELHSYRDTDCDLIVLRQFADDTDLEKNDRIWLSFIYALCNCAPTALYIFNHLPFPATPEQVDRFWYDAKPLLVFLDRSSLKRFNWIVGMINDFVLLTKGEPNFHELETPAKTYDHIYNEAIRWHQFSKKNAASFTEAIGVIAGIPTEMDRINWRKGGLTTYGMLYMLYKDEEAEVHREKRLMLNSDVKMCDKALIQFMIDLFQMNAPVSTISIAKNLRLFGSMFLGNYYVGYHTDRQITALKHLEQSLPEEQDLWTYVWQVRASKLNPMLLGEVQGWKQISNPRLDFWRKYGRIGVENR